MKRNKLILAVCMCLTANLRVSECAASTSSTYLGNNQRTGYARVQIPGSPALEWVYKEVHPPRHAWKEPNREMQFIDFDYATQTTIADGRVYFGSSADHKLYALDLATGERQWHFYTEGPIRFAPVYYQGRIYAVSDDGFLYCLDATNGRLIWKHRGGPSSGKLIGNDQMISHWPARSGVLIEKDRLYFTAGMWSRDGVFIYCLDPSDGSEIWKNDTSGYHFATLPHGSGYAGVAPQGYLALHRGRLYVPTGRGAPAAFDATTGDFQFYENGLGYKPHQPGGSRVMAWRDWVVFRRRSHHDEEVVRYEPRDPAVGPASGLFAIDFATGRVAWSLTARNVVAAHGDSLILGGQGPVIKTNIDDLMTAYTKYWKDGENLGHDHNITESGVEYAFEFPSRLTPKPSLMSPLPFKQWEADVGLVFVLLCAGDTILAGGRGIVSAIDFESGKVLWQKEIKGEARGICAVDGHFVVSSTAGKLYCFGAGKGSDREISQRIVKPKISSEAAEIAADILKTSGIDAGYALVLGAGDGQLLAGLVEQSDLLVYCLEPDAKKAAAVQKMLDAAGLLGVRAAVHCGTSDTLPYNPYFANLVVWDSSSTILNAPELYRVLRPCGGVACLLGGDSAAMRTSLRSANVPAEEITKSSIGAIVRRGKLPETGEWTHPHANIGRTGCSEDAIARLPLGMLWWGGPGPARIVSRHWRAPVPLFANGVLYVQGQHDVFAIDAYNGREMWNRHIENVGRFPPTHRGGNIIADDNGVYCVQGTKCQYLDIQTGKTIREYEFHLTDAHRRAMNELLPDGTDPESKRIVWEYLGLSGDILLGTLGHEKVAKQEQEGLPDTDGIQQSRFLFAIDLKHIQQSRFLFAIDRNSGRLLWEKTLDRSVSPTAIVADSQSVYLLDRDGGAKYSAFRRKGVGTAVSELKAIDLATGRVSWTSKEMPPAWKSLMLRGDVLVAYPNPAEASSIDGDEGVGVFDSTSGKMLWSKEKLSHVSETGRGGTMRHTFIVGDTLFLPWAFDLRTGEEKLLEEHPITGRPERFHVPGKNFCGTFSAAKDLLIYRSASIGFAEINRDSGSYWLPESRPSCWISVIPAGGVVLAPEGYSTCICPYNFKTSLAMIPVERHENWSVYLAGGRRENRLNRKPEKREKYLASVSELSRNVHSLHVNINAPGDQMDSEGRLWLAWPRPFNPTQNYSIQPVPIQMEGRETGFRLNSDYHQISGTQAPWLYTSGLAGPLKFIVDLDGDEADYDVTLNFAEIEDAKRGERVFDVKVQGKIVLASLDVVVAADGTNRALMKIFRNIPAKDTLTVELIPVRGKPILCSLSVTREQTR